MSSYKTSNVDELNRLSPRYILFPSGSTATAQDIIDKLTARYEFAGTKWIATKYARMLSFPPARPGSSPQERL